MLRRIDTKGSGNGVSAGLNAVAAVALTNTHLRYQLPLSAMNTLPHMDGVTGRVYLRASVASLADRCAAGIAGCT